MDSPVAVSAVPPQRHHSPTGTKRRQSNADEREEDGKRQRVECDEEDRTRIDATDAHNSRPDSLISEQKPAGDESTKSRHSRKSGTGTEEKQRGKRLFGALLGNLNQSGDRVAKRRQEIESRRKAETQRLDDELRETQNRNLARLAEHRRIALKKVDDENYYRPWDLRPDEEDRIADQVREARAQIDRELQRTRVQDGPGSPAKADAPADHETTMHPDVDIRSTNADNANETGEAQAKSAEDALSEPAKAANIDIHTENTNVPSPSPTVNSDTEAAVEAESKQTVLAAADVHADDDGDHIVEGDEDTVIY
nr:hypothetical protein CFP56_70637 [Quercus suber]